MKTKTNNKMFGITKKLEKVKQNLSKILYKTESNIIIKN